EFTTLVLKKRMEELLEAPSRATLQDSVLPQYLPKRRWFAGKETVIEHVQIAYGVRFGAPTSPVLLSEIVVQGGGRSSR
ncbi:hypothetical protein EI534_47585, partial [Pseudomonas frederiksbergensis]|nr:hypothetical protein [Pseudomonas frederiksbergensis]